MERGYALGMALSPEKALDLALPKSGSALAATVYRAQSAARR